MKIHHIALVVNNIKESIDFYCNKYGAWTQYEDEEWAMLEFDNILLALVLPGKHPPHICFEWKNANKIGKLKEHRDRTKSIYVMDPSQNIIELLDSEDSRQLELNFNN